MNVFVIKAYGRYCGGMAVVAANTSERARELMAALKREDYWSIPYGGPDDPEDDNNTVTLLPVSYDGAEGVLAHFEHGE